MNLKRLCFRDLCIVLEMLKRTRSVQAEFCGRFMILLNRVEANLQSPSACDENTHISRLVPNRIETAGMFNQRNAAAVRRRHHHPGYEELTALQAG